MSIQPSIDDVRELLRRDSLAEAEKITDKSYKNDPATMTMGFMGHLDLVQARKNALMAINDTHNAQTIDEHLAVFFDLGFKVIYTEDFYGTPYGYNETTYILWHDIKSILGVVETYSEKLVNTSKIYYNVKLSSIEALHWRYTSSHSGVSEDDLVLCGDHDTREGLRVAIDGLEKMGSFMVKWTKRPWYRFVNYMDWKRSTVKTEELTEKRLNQLPQEVQVVINI